MLMKNFFPFFLVLFEVVHSNLQFWPYKLHGHFVEGFYNKVDERDLILTNLEGICQILQVRGNWKSLAHLVINLGGKFLTDSKRPLFG